MKIASENIKEKGAKDESLGTPVWIEPMALSEDESKKLSFSIPRKPKGVFLLQKISECLFLNGNQDIVLLIRTIYNKEEQVYYDSRVGNFIGVTVVGKFLAKHWNDDTAYLEHVKGMLETFCKSNYNLVKKPLMERKVIPTITIRPLKAVIQEHPNLLMCVTSGFYPQSINVTLLKNGGEVTHDIASSGVIPNGDWTYQITLLMEFIPQKEDVYSCKVEHSSLKEPMIMDWKYPGAKLSK
ncbi:H-2 class II histocompatibility antigen, E-S beta chain-like [Protopterus annectens]|uniref:H-2 class II histocompatibility antigen, E-S beta chain-like n=1 Tax=Protopterus annectens TaxID=7888 RepID=UPI001CF9301E|nr:H-2 class II histocompatibility antigen, E-S beta chain-like [Protopterus annectens]